MSTASPTAGQIERLPQLDLLREKGWEVLYCLDRTDQLVMDMFRSYAGKPFRSAADGELELGGEAPGTLDDIRKRIVNLVEDGAPKEAIEMLAEARYRIFDAMVELPGFSFLAIGRPESAGCYCKVNAYLKEVISLLSQDFDFVVIDGEAGIEQINRRVMEKVTHLVLITDPSRKGVQVVQTIRRVADELVMYERCGVIVNRLTDPALLQYVQLPQEDLLAVIGTDTAHSVNDIEGKTVFDLPADSPILSGAKTALKKLELL